MFTNIRDIWQLSILNKLFNIRSSEWRRVSFAWGIAFLYRMGLVIGWTILVALFVSRYGILSLPYLFIIRAIFTILGSLLYSLLLDRFSNKFLMIMTVFISSLLLLIAAYFAQIHEVLFFALVIVTEAFFLSQFRILMTGFFEEMFTPLESERTFPIVEAAITCGGIFAGLLILSLANSIPGAHFLYFWIALLLMTVPFLIFSEHILDDLLFFREKKQRREKSVTLFAKLKQGLLNKSQFSFLKGLVIVVFFQWVLFNLLEFQYTKAIYANVSSVILEGGSGLEHAFVHDLGALFLLFSFSALIFQLFFAGRVIISIGIVGSMLLHPFVALLSLFGLTVSFNFQTAVFAKNNFNITSVLYNNSYHSSFYAVDEKLKPHMRELIEGVVRPIGALAGTLILIFLQKLLFGEQMIFSVNVAMILVSLILFVVLYLQQDKYTRVAIGELVDSKNLKVRINAVDILAQKGHRSSLPVLNKVLLNEDEPVSLRIKILRALGELKSRNAVKVLIGALNSSEPLVCEVAVEVLLEYSKYQRFSKKHLFLDYVLIDTLKSLYSKKRDTFFRQKIINLLSQLSNIATLDYLLSLLKKPDPKLRADVIYALRSYCDDGVVPILQAYLKSKNLRQKVNAAIVLNKSPKFFKQTNRIFNQLLLSHKQSDVVNGLHAVGELSLKKYKKICIPYLNSKSAKMRMHSAIALAKMGCGEAMPVLIELLFSGNDKTRKETQYLLKNVDVRISQNIDRMVKHLVSHKIIELMQSNGNKALVDLDSRILKNLRVLYDLVEEYDEVEKIDAIINSSKT